MRYLTLAALIGLSVAASSCGSKVGTYRTFPPVSDLRPAPEPAYPLLALEDTPEGREAEALWWNETLLWGRGEAARVRRICQWASDLGMKVPKDYCK